MPATMYSEKRGSALWITLDRSDRKNAINLTLVEELSQALDAAMADKTVRAVVITGAGDAFCAGADLADTGESVRNSDSGDKDQILHFLKRFELLLRRIRALPKPVLTAINGVTCAGGLELVACCDINVAAESASFSDAHSRWGFLPGLGGGRELARAVGSHKAKEMMFTADFYSAAQMAASGLINHVVPASALTQFTESLVAKLANKSPRGLAKMKQLINDGTDIPSDVAARYEMLCLEAQLHSPDFLIGISAFENSTAPEFPEISHPGWRGDE